MHILYQVTRARCFTTSPPPLNLPLANLSNNNCNKNSRAQACYYQKANSIGFLAPLNEQSLSAFFLDHRYFASSLSNRPRMSLPLPPYVLSEIGARGEQRRTAVQYFSTVHQWMPIISKMRFFNLLMNTPDLQHTDVGILSLVMKLVTWTPSADGPDPRTTTYFAAKQLLYTSHAASAMTLLALQAHVLMAVYEIGHAIYPAAHISVGACINYAATLGLGWTQRTCEDSDLSWVEVEEQRRVWWAIVILDRCV